METMRARSWNWTRDELILALDLYFQLDPTKLWSQEPAVAALSETLRALPLFPIEDRPDNFRNTTGVYFKLLNLWYIATDGKSGYSNYGAADKQVWDEFAQDRERLHAVAAAIRRGMSSQDAAVPDEDPDDSEAPEGRILLRLHRARERNRTLVQERKRRALRQDGTLKCEACGFDFRASYGEIGDGFIECHHTVPVSQLAPNQRTKVSDLALVCANCHRILHRGGQLLTIAGLKERISHACKPATDA